MIVRVPLELPSLQPVNAQPQLALAEICCADPTAKVPPPLTVPPLLGLARTVIVAVCCWKLAWYVMLVGGTVIVRAALGLPSLHAVNTQPLVGLAVSKTFVPTAQVPPPLTVPPLLGLARPVTVAVSEDTTVKMASAIALGL